MSRPLFSLFCYIANHYIFQVLLPARQINDEFLTLELTAYAGACQMILFVLDNLMLWANAQKPLSIAETQVIA